MSDSQTSARASLTGKTQKENKAHSRRLLTRTIMAILGTVIMTVGLGLFLVPNHIMDGGVVGVSIITSHLLILPLGIFIFVLNFPFIFLGYKQIDKTFALSTALGMTVFSSATTIFLHNFEPFISNELLVTLFGGIISGVGIGIVNRYDGSLEGTKKQRIESKIIGVKTFLRCLYINSQPLVFIKKLGVSYGE
ncbi:YitT family protein [Lysinibacillus sp. NPDC048646]|uniref:YitT family protein n=1 Tax=Lysinibacillus sp. NPDC048646 TaxID=3390574 RepID=UPI003CFCD13B